MSEKINAGNLLLPENKRVAFNIFVREATGGRCMSDANLSGLSLEVRKVIGDLAIIESRIHSPDLLILLFYVGTLTRVMQKGHKMFLCKVLNRQVRKFDPALTIVPSAWRWKKGRCHEIDCFVQLSIRVCRCDMERQIKEGVKKIDEAIRASGIGIPLCLSDRPLNLKICQCGHLMLDEWEECIYCGEK
ncbi:MAG: hypothetical protein WA103_02445 [Minisyncoccales bacterium]